MSEDRKNLPVQIVSRPPSVFSGAEAFESAQRMAKALVASNLVPKEYQGNQGIPNAMIALEMAQRVGASPMAVMQNLHVIHGRPSWSSSFIIASLNSCGRFSPLRFVVEGEGDNKSCYAWTYDSTGEKLEGPAASIKMAKEEGWFNKNGSKWKTMPELMLRYRAAAFFGRLYAPDILMGMHADDEVQDMGPRNITDDAAPVLVTEVEGSETKPAEPETKPAEPETKQAEKATEPEKQETQDAVTEPDPDSSHEPDREAIKAELKNLGVEFNDRAQTKTLESLLEDARQEASGEPKQEQESAGEAEAAPPPLADTDAPPAKKSGGIDLF